LDKEISDRVIEAIQESGLTDAELAHKVGVSAPTVWRWRNGETTKFSSRQIENIANVLQVNFDYLRFGEGKLKPTPSGSQNQGSDHTDPVAKARLSIDQLGESLSAYTSQGLRSDDPQRLIELAEMLLRTARELMKNK
jgi:transcriptional regulator with XRE-family HTH domain